MLGRAKDNIETEEGYRFITKDSIELLNKRILSEEHAGRLYRSMAIWFKYNGYNGFHKFWAKWADEENIHASWAREYLLDLDVLPEIRDIVGITCKFESIKDIVNQTLQAEIDITKECNELALHAVEVKDHMLINLAHKYTDEQQEEINKITNILTKVKLYGGDKLAIMELDEKIGELK